MDNDIRLDNAHILVGDALQRLKELPDNSVDSIVTDPPYGLSDNKFVAETITKWIQGERDFIPDGKGFMGKAWDSFVPPPAIWDECFRVLKPGGHLLSFFGTRTQDIGALAIRLAGFEIRDSISWVYGSGFPKSLNISKAIDKQAGAEREVIGKDKAGKSSRAFQSLEETTAGEYDITAPATDAAKQWEGWGTALKPAHEPIVVARKPVEGTVTNNVLQWGTGGLNIDASRIGYEDTPNPATNPKYRAENGYKTPERGQESEGAVAWTSSQNKTNTSGRFPANLILSHSEDCVDTGETITESYTNHNAPKGTFAGGDPDRGSDTSEYRAQTTSTPVYRCVPGCPVAELDEQSGVSKSSNAPRRNTARENESFGAEYENTTFGHSDTGGASRFFYVAKANKKDRNEGLEQLEDGKIPYQNYRENLDAKGGDTPFAGAGRSGNELKNFHPTVKPTQLMEYLVRLVTPEGGTVLDPFTGSGSTGKAAILNGFKFIGCELTEDYLPIIEGRLRFAEQKLTEPQPVVKKTVRKNKKVKEVANDTLF